jgi:hypothetical protein
MLLVVSFLAHQVLSIIVGSQIEIKRIFYLINILTNLRSSFSINFLKKIVSKNWINDSRVGFKTPFNLVKVIKMDVHLKKRLEEFDGEFERE